MPDEPLTAEQLEARVPEDPVDWDLDERDAWMDEHDGDVEDVPVSVVVKENE